MAEVTNNKDNLNDLSGQQVTIAKDGTPGFFQADVSLKPGEIVFGVADGKPNVKVKQAATEGHDADDDFEDISDDVAQILAALEQGEDPTQLGEEFATAAGETQGSSLVTSAEIARDAESTLAEAGFDTQPLQELGLSEAQSLAIVRQYSAFINFSDSSSTSDSAEPDTTATGAPGVEITEDANDDGLLSAAELDGDVNVTISLTDTGAVAGDTLTVNGTEIELTQAHIDADQVLTTVDAPAEGATLIVEATITDKAGNVSLPGSDSAKLDLEATAGTVTVDDITA
ncbi:hypothetical protein NNL38_05145, partial [Photobacterium atrarenae]